MSALHRDVATTPCGVLVIHAHPDDEVFATAAATVTATYFWP